MSCLPSRSWEGDGAAGASLRDPRRKPSESEPVRDILSHREEQDQGPEQDNAETSLSARTRYETLHRQAHDLDQVSSLPRSSRSRIPSQGEAKIGFRKFRNGRDPWTDLQCLRA